MKKKTKKAVNVVLVALLALGTVVLVVWLASSQGGHSEPKGTYHSPTVFAMDTTLDLTIQGRSTAEAKADADAAVALARKIEGETTRFKPQSDVEKIDAQAGVAPVKVSDDTYRIIEESLKYSRLTNGAFDITVAPLVRLWGFYDQKYRVPTAAEIAQVKSLVDYRKVQLDPVNKTVMLADKGMELDLGGVAKGYAVGELSQLLKARGVKHALVNFGGAVGAVGDRVDGKAWVVGIKDPRGTSGDIIGQLDLKDRFVSTSGDYERFFIKDGKRYFHIFDPATGYNPQNAVSTTVAGPSGMDADILSKIIVMGQQRAMEFMKTQPEFQGLFIDGAGTVYLTPEFKSKYAVDVKNQI